MISLRKAKGQGALEYLLLIGGAILIAVIVIALLVGMSNKSKENVETQTDQVTDALSAPVPVTINSINAVDCDTNTDTNISTLWVNVKFTENVVPKVGSTTIYSANLLNGLNDTWLTTTDGVAGGVNIDFDLNNDFDGNLCKIGTYFVVIDTNRTFNNESKYVSSMKNSFHYQPE